jgi:hypothetical protein
MKISELRKLIREEIAIAKNAPAKEKETTEAPPKEKPGVTPKRRGFDKPAPGVKPAPKNEGKEKSIADQIAARFLKLKK